MQTGFFIRGGWDSDKSPFRNERNLAGLPSRQFRGPFYFRFPIADRHTAYEWAMALADVPPYAHWVADLNGSRGDLGAKTVAGMQARERAVEGYSEKAKAIYYALKAEVDTGRLVPLRPELCAARPGIDPPYVEDFTCCVFGLDQVLTLIRRRGDDGRLIRKLLAMETAAAIDQLSGQAFSQSDTLGRAPASESQMAARTTEPPRPPEPADDGSVPSGRKRTPYKAALAEWMARKGIRVLRRMDPSRIADGFKAYCNAERNDLLSLLPQRLRSMEGTIRRILMEMETADKAAGGGKSGR